MCTKFWSQYLKGRDHSEDVGVDGKIIVEWILGKYGGASEPDASSPNLFTLFL
jgi:hypothetical protein